MFLQMTRMYMHFDVRDRNSRIFYRREFSCATQFSLNYCKLKHMQIISNVMHLLVLISYSLLPFLFLYLKIRNVKKS